jgi:type IV pilus assembly protein PilV
MHYITMKKMKPNQMIKPATRASKQGGVMVLEAMMAILIFSLGIISLMSLQAAAIRLSGDAKYRTDAAFLASKLISQMWVADPATLVNFNYNQTATADPCAPTPGGGSAMMTNWLNTNFNLPGDTPGAPPLTKQRVTVNGNTVQVSFCWHVPGETNWHNYQAVSSVVKNPLPTAP